MIRFRLAAFLVATFLGWTVPAEAAPLGDNSALDKKILTDGKTIIRSGAASATVEVAIATHIVDIGKPGDPTPDVRRTNCTYSRYPCSLVDEIAISVGSNKIIVPRSVFADLADLNRGRVQGFKNGKWKLLADGGDASEGYKLNITFDRSRVLERRVSSGEFPEDFEVTTYVERVKTER